MNISEVHHQTPKQAVALVEDALFAKLVPMLHGSPAIGKSAIIHWLAARLNLLVIDARMAGFDPTDLNGFPVFVDGVASYMPMDTFPLQGRELPTKADGSKYSGWLLFLDEFNSAPLSVQAAAYKLILDRMLGSHLLHKNCAIVAAGNLDDDGAITNPMSSAMVSRLVHIVVKPSLPDWLEWALQNGINSKLCAFLEFKPALFYTFNKEEPAHIYCGPRPLEFASRLMARWGDDVPLAKAPLMAGTISEGVTTELRQFLAHYQHLPTLGDILANPAGVTVPILPGVLYALDGCLGDWMDADNIAALLTFIDRMPEEHRIILFRITLRKNPAIRSNPKFLKWATDNASYFVY